MTIHNAANPTAPWNAYQGATLGWTTHFSPRPTATDRPRAQATASARVSTAPNHHMSIASSLSSHL